MSATERVALRSFAIRERTWSDVAAVTPEQILKHIRGLYVQTLAQVVARTEDAIIEPALRDDRGEIAREGKLALGLRVDLVPLVGGRAQEPLGVESHTMVSFEAFRMKHGSLDVELQPFVWDAVRIDLVEVSPSAPLSMLQQWFVRWFDEEGRREPDPHTGLHGVAHVLCDPIADGTNLRIIADLGSCPLTGFFELLDALTEARPTRVVVSAAQFGDDEPAP